MWLRFTVGGLVIRIRNLSSQTRTRKILKYKTNLSHNKSLISYITGLGIGVGSTDNVLLKKLKGITGGGKRR